MNKCKEITESDKKIFPSKKKRIIFVSLISVFVILFGAIIYNLMLSDVTEDIYFLTWDISRGAILYCYDASEQKVIEVTEIKGRYYGDGIIDLERNHLIMIDGYEMEEARYDQQLIDYDIEQGEAEVCFRVNELNQEMGMELANILYDDSDKSFVYLIFRKEGQRYLAKYYFDTREISEPQELDYPYWIADHGNLYRTVYTESDCEVFAYSIDNSQEKRVAELPLEIFWDITTDQTCVLLQDDGKYMNEYYIYDLNTGERTTVTRFLDFPVEIFFCKDIHFLGDGDSCIYIFSNSTFCDSQDNALYVKEPGHLPRKIFAFNYSRSGYYITLL